jgi:hypothetical protein
MTPGATSCTLGESRPIAERRPVSINSKSAGHLVVGPDLPRRRIHNPALARRILKAEGTTARGPDSSGHDKHGTSPSEQLPGHVIPTPAVAEHQHGQSGSKAPPGSQLKILTRL